MIPTPAERRLFAPVAENNEQRLRAIDETIRKRNPERYKNALKQPKKKYP